MSNLCARRRFPTASAVLLSLLLATNAWAQAPSDGSNAPQDPFHQVQAALSNAADNLLATAAQRPPERPQVIPASAAEHSEAAAAANVSGRAGSSEKAVQRVEQLRPVIEPILRAENVPTELIAVVLIESGGQPSALSPKGARGIWQFMPDTARRYGLVVGPGADERLDVQKSTRAAARYLRDLYQRFGNWSLALAAYNAGEDTIDAASGRVGSTDFTRISSRLPLETRNYVPAVLSAMGRVPTLPPAPLLARSTRHVFYAAANLD